MRGRARNAEMAGVTAIQWLANKLLFIDCTYKTSQFNMSLLNIGGATGNNMTCHFAVAFWVERRWKISRGLWRNPRKCWPNSTFPTQRSSLLKYWQRTCSSQYLRQIVSLIRLHHLPLNVGWQGKLIWGYYITGRYSSYTSCAVHVTNVSTTQGPSFILTM